MCDHATGAAPHTDAARHPAISLATAAAFSEAACAQRQTAPAGHGGAGPGPTSPHRLLPHAEVTSEGAGRKRKLPEAEVGETQRKRRKRGRRHGRRAGRETPGEDQSLPENPTLPSESRKTTERTSVATEHSRGEELPGQAAAAAQKLSEQAVQSSDNRTDVRVEDSGMCSPTAAQRHAPDPTPDGAAAADTASQHSKDLILSEDTPADQRQHHDGPPGGANRICADLCGFSDPAGSEVQSRADECNHEKEKVSGESAGGGEQRGSGACSRIDPGGCSGSSSSSSSSSSSGSSSGGSDGDAIDSGQRGGGNHGADCNHCTNAVDWNAGVLTRRGGGGGREGVGGEEEGRKQAGTEVERTWANRRERGGRRDVDRFCPEKRPRLPLPLPPGLPPHCIPLHAPLLLTPPPLCSSSSSPCSSSAAAFSFQHTIVQHHLSLLPPPPHLALHSYPHPFPAFSPHLPPLRLNPPPPPPPPPSFYASPPIPLLNAPGPFPLAAAFHPLPTHPHPHPQAHPHPHPPPLYPATHPAVLPLQMLF